MANHWQKHQAFYESPEGIKRRLLERSEKITESGCWVWTGYVTRSKPPTGVEYGRLKAFGSLMRAHKASWLVFKGPLKKGQWLLHRCNNSVCINPDHLYLGTHEENMRDMAIAGRSPHLRISNEDAALIRARKIPGSVSQIADRFGVNISSIKRIRNGKTRRHI